MLTYAVQVNGKLRSEVSVPAESGEPEVRRAAEANDKVMVTLKGKQVRRVVFVPKRLINFVVTG
jgi:leucyl-tRNA synthetase